MARRKPNRPKIDPSVYIADTATVVGEVTIGKSASVWFSAVVRGDIAPVRIGEASNIQDGAVLHVGHGHPCLIGRRVTIGHGAMVHGATVKDDVMIGIGAIVLNGAVVGEQSLVAAGAVVTEGMVIPPGSLVMGLPARVVRPVSEKQKETIRAAADNYVNYSAEYKRRPRRKRPRSR